MIKDILVALVATLIVMAGAADVVLTLIALRLGASEENAIVRRLGRFGWALVVTAINVGLVYAAGWLRDYPGVLLGGGVLAAARTWVTWGDWGAIISSIRAARRVPS